MLFQKQAPVLDVKVMEECVPHRAGIGTQDCKRGYLRCHSFERKLDVSAHFKGVCLLPFFPITFFHLWISEDLKG